MVPHQQMQRRAYKRLPTAISSPDPFFDDICVENETTSFDYNRVSIVTRVKLCDNLRIETIVVCLDRFMQSCDTDSCRLRR